MSTFDKLGLKKDIIDVLTSLKYKESFEVQDQIIPLVLKGENIVFTSKTGSGKTLAYTLGFLSKINKKLGPQMIVVVPTRELCTQVGKEINKICEPLGIKVGMLHGGREISGDYKTTNKRLQIVVGTPGRLIQHINNKTVRVGDVKYIVYDESDEMFDNGFAKECAYLKARSSRDAQIILSSATITEKVEEFIENIIQDFVFLRIGNLIPKNIEQNKIECEIEDKNDMLIKFFKDKKFKRAMIFCNTKVRCDEITDFLIDNKFNAKFINSDLSQDERYNLLNLFKAGKIQILVTTDVAARGLQIPKVDMVINYDVPRKQEFYIHRIGRTGRTDQEGYALTLVCSEDEDRFNDIEFDFELNVKDITQDYK
ncbi:DEAD/DEAH box helicase [Candidatus Woesearchaeota archaeon]|nr:DEAD/DEAH box helicase [Candidatus Woesearchaeota archaeon]